VDNLLLNNLNSSDNLVDLMLEDINSLVFLEVNLWSWFAEGWFTENNSLNGLLEVSDSLVISLNDLS